MSDVTHLVLTQEQTQVMVDFIKANGPFIFSKSLESMRKRSRREAEFVGSDCEKFIAQLSSAGIKLPNSESYDVRVTVDGNSKLLLAFRTEHVENQTHIYMGHADTARVDDGTVKQECRATVNLETLYALCDQHGISDKKPPQRAM